MHRLPVLVAPFVSALLATPLAATEVGVAVGDPTALEGSGNTALVTITRDAGDVAEALVVNFVVGGSSTAVSTDYSLTGAGLSFDGAVGSLSIPAGETEASIVLTAGDDAEEEGRESVVFELAAGAYTPDPSQSSARITIFESGFLVTNTDDNGPGSLRQAIADANASPTRATIDFDDVTPSSPFADELGPDVIYLESSLNITASMAIRGLGAGRSYISGDLGKSLGVGATSEKISVFDIDVGESTAGGAVVLSDLTIRDAYGRHPLGSAVDFRDGLATLEIWRCHITNCDESAIVNFGNLLVVDSRMGPDLDVGVLNQGSLAMYNSVMTGHHGSAINQRGGSFRLANTSICDNAGLGIHTSGLSGDSYLTNCTICRNEGGRFDPPGRAVNWDTGKLYIANTIVAGSGSMAGEPPSPNDVWGRDPVISLGHNYIGVATVWLAAPGDQVGTPLGALPVPVGPYVRNGGRFGSFIPLPDSAIVDTGNDSAIDSVNFPRPPYVEGAISDQRGQGFPRIVGGAVDIGATEAANAVSFAHVETELMEPADGEHSEISVEVLRSGDLTGAVSVAWAVEPISTTPANPADFGGELPSGRAHFAPGQRGAEIRFRIYGDGTLDADEQFLIALSDPPQGLDIQGEGLPLRIRNTDSTEILIDPVTLPEGSGGGTTSIEVAVRSTSRVDGGFKLPFTLSGYADQSPIQGDVVAEFAGLPREVVPIRFNVPADDIAEGNTRVRVHPRPIEELRLGIDYRRILDGLTDQPFQDTPFLEAAFLQNDDQAVLRAIAVDPQVEEGAVGSVVNAEFRVDLDREVNGAFIVQYATRDGTATTADGDYISTTGELVFDGFAGEVHTFSVPVVGDAYPESDEYFEVGLEIVWDRIPHGSDIPGGMEPLAVGAPGAFVIEDEDTTASTVDLGIRTNASVVEEGSAGVTRFQLVRSDSSGEFVAELGFGFANSSTIPNDFILSGPWGEIGSLPLTVTFPDGVSSLEFTLRSVDDEGAEPEETLVLGIGRSTNYRIDPTHPVIALTVPANDFAVTNTNDSGGGSLRQAIANAEEAPGEQSITFSDGGGVDFSGSPQLIRLTSGRLRISTPMSIIGPELPGRVSVSGDADASGTPTSADSRVFYIARWSATEVLIRNLTITGGYTNTDNIGGGVFVFNWLYNVTDGPDVTLDRCTIKGNTANWHGGGVGTFYTSVALTNCVVCDNYAGSQGGGLHVNALWDPRPARVTNSTFSGNIADGNSGHPYRNRPGLGGAMFSETELVVTNTTIVGNDSDVGGAIASAPGMLSVQNSIIAGNSSPVTASPDVTADVISLGNNLVGDFTSVTPFSQPGDLSFPDLGITDITDVIDPVLADNGGYTLTHALVPDSPAIDAGVVSVLGAGSFPSPPFAANGAIDDQRGEGYPRVFGAQIDIGAYEFAQPGAADLVPPYFSPALPDLVVQLQPGATGATVDWLEPKAIDNRDGLIGSASTHHPGAEFPVGTTTVTYSATDAAGNLGEHSFKVTVLESYARWADSHGMEGEDGQAEADCDHDGLTNAMEFMLGTNPKVSESAEATLLTPGRPAFGTLQRSGSTYVRLSYWRRIGSHGYRLSPSHWDPDNGWDDSETWIAYDPEPQEVWGGEFEYVTARFSFGIGSTHNGGSRDLILLRLELRGE